jgi:dihydrofolate reductase
MTGVLFMMSISLDGYFETLDRGLEWQLIDAELHAHFNDVARDAAAFLDGRITWELMAGYWPTADDDPDEPQEIRDFAAIWRDKPKYVFSRTLHEAGWNTTILRAVDRTQVDALVQKHGRPLGVGGAALAASFAALDLIDEYRFYVHPVLLGDGRRPFAGPPSRSLSLEETRTFSNGVVLLRYTRSR